MKRRAGPHGPPLPGGLLLERAEGPKFSLRSDDFFHGGGAEGADQRVLEVFDAHVETELFHIEASEVGAEAGLLETAPELSSPPPRRRDPPVSRRVPAGRTRSRKRPMACAPPDRHDGNAFSVEVPAAPLGECLDSGLIADSLDEHDCAR